MNLSKLIQTYPNDQELGKRIRTNFASSFETRPWGWFEVLTVDPTYKVKRFVVVSGKRLSYQYHNNRTEQWVIVQGTGNFILNAINHEVKAGDVLTIKPGDYHRIHNIGVEDLIVIETQLGICDESDIVRIDDDFNRNTYV